MERKFLISNKDEHKITNLLGHGCTILGLPFSNQENRMTEFSKAINELIEKL